MASSIEDYKRYADDDIRTVAEGTGTEDERLKRLQGMNERETRKLGAAREYTPGADIDGSRAQEGAALVNKMRNDDIDEAMALVAPDRAAQPQSPDGAAQPASAQPPVPATSAPAPAPAKPSLENGDTVVRDGKGETMFGKYKRVVDQKSGEEKWINTETGKEEVPKSEQMRRMMMDGHTSLGVQSAGFKKPFDGADSWDAAIAAQKSGEQAEALARSRAYGAQLLEQQRHGEEVARKRLTNRRLAAGDAFGVALGGLNAEIARTEDGKIIGADGRPVDRRVRVSSDGKHIYLMSSVGPEALKTANAQRRKNGGESDYNSIVAFREIDVNGNPVKDKNGNDIPPYIAVRDTPGGQSGTDVKQRFRTMSLRDVADKLFRAHVDAGHGDGDAVKTATIEQLGGWDPNGWGKTLKPKADGKLTFDQRKELEELKENGKNHRAGMRQDINLTKIEQDDAHWKRDYELRLKKAETEEERAALAKEKQDHDADVKEMNAIGAILNVPGIPRETKDELKRILGGHAIEISNRIGKSNQTTVKPSDNNGGGSIDISGLSKADALSKLRSAPDGSTATIGGKPCIKKGGKWIEK